MTLPSSTWVGSRGYYEGRTTLTVNSFTLLLRRLSRAGFKPAFVRSTILPDWWTEDCAKDPNLLPEIEIRAARFLKISLASLREPTTDFTRPLPQGAQLRRVRDIKLDRLAPAIHVALQVGSAVIRNRRNPVAHELPGPDTQVWRDLLGVRRTLTLDVLLGFLWERGVPVIPLLASPSPTFQALAAVVDSVPVIVLGHRIDEPGRVAFLIAHELAHIAYGDCQAECPVIEASDEAADDADIEVRADSFAKALLVGLREVPVVHAEDYRALAEAANQLETIEGLDAGAVIWAWANKTRDYAVAQRALAALYRNVGAQRELLRHFEACVDLENATDSDRDLLRCVVGDLEDDSAST